MRHGPLLPLLLLAACGTKEPLDTGETVPPPTFVDEDGDGWAAGQGDCDDAHADAHPGGTEVWYDGIDQDCMGGDDYDVDQDGAPAAESGGTDCDDGDPAVSPTADEVCNGVDDDCDGETDEDSALDVATWYLDGDLDGWGNTLATAVSCAPPEGSVALPGDCDDADPTLYPGATEVCDGLDQDCDTLVDDEPVDGVTSYTDADWDGYGDPATVRTDCEMPEGNTADGTDCDDTNISVHPLAWETCDGVDQDCDGLVDEDAWGAARYFYDLDGDGYGDMYSGDSACDAPVGSVEVGGDCDDGDGAIHPLAWDNPGDGVDQDCDGADRSFDGLVLGYGDGGSTSITADLPPTASGLDVVVLLDTTGSMGTAVYSLDFQSMADALPASVTDLAWGLATFDDYPTGTYGVSPDIPFLLYQQVTPDVEEVQAARESVVMHSGGDWTESSMEALYQAFTGAGYDMECDGVYESGVDVPPFLASAEDPFGGTADGTWDPALEGGGSLGGMGFREGRTPILAYITDAPLRDPDVGYGTPGGCPTDATGTMVVEAATALGARLVGISYNYTYAWDQMVALAEATGSTLDLDGDGVLDPLVYQLSFSDDLNLAVAEAVWSVAASLDEGTTWSTVTLEVVDDPYGMVQVITPASYCDVTSTDGALPFSVSFVGTVAEAASELSTEVVLGLYGDGVLLDTYTVAIEVPPL